MKIEGTNTKPNRRKIRSKGPALDEMTFLHLRRRIADSSGIYVPSDESSRFVLERRLAPRLRVQGVTSFADYKKSLDDAEIEAMLDVVAVHETYFFREKRQLKVFADEILPELAGLGRPLKIWSAGCSTGEEPYTIAMLMAERGLLGRSRAQVFASDLSQRVVESGSRALYNNSSFRTTDDFFKTKYFAEAGQGLWRVVEPLRSSVHFSRFNLVRPDLQSNGGPPGKAGFDSIFCRNVLMYFEAKAVKQTLTLFHSLLREGGYLLLGHAETLFPLDMGFEPLQFGRELVYRK